MPAAQAYFNPDLSYRSFDMLADSYNRTLMMNESLFKDVKKRPRQSRRANSSNGTPVQAEEFNRVAGVANYGWSAALSTRIRREMIDSLRENLRQSGQLNAGTEQQLQALNDSQMMSNLQGELRKAGYEPWNLVTAMSYFATINYGIANGLDISRLRADDIIRQLGEGMSQGTALLELDDEDRQNIAERLYWIASLQLAVYLQGSPQQKQDMAASSRQALAQLGAGRICKNGNMLSLCG